MKHFLLCALFWCATAQAFIYDVVVMRQWCSANNSYHYCIGFCDFHDKLDISNGEQVAKIDACLHQCNPGSLHMLTEDLSSAGCGGRKSCGKFIIDSHGGVLGGLAARCRKCGIEVDNVEYRYCRVVAFAPVMRSVRSNLHVDVSSFLYADSPSVQQVKIADLIHEMFEVMQEVRKFNDGEKLTKWYQDTLADIHEHCTELKLQKNADLTIAQYLASHLHPTGDRAALLRQLLMFDSNLIDLKLVHAIVTAKKPYTVICAGGSHIDRVADALSKVGYEKVYRAGAQWPKKSAYAGVHVKMNKVALRPQPVAPQILDRVLNTITSNKNF